MCKKLVSLCVALVLGLGSLAYADAGDFYGFVLGNWEGTDLDGWTNGNLEGYTGGHGYTSGNAWWAGDPTGYAPTNTANGSGVGTMTPQNSNRVTLDNYSLRMETPETWWNEIMVIDLAQVDYGVDAFFDNDTFSIDIGHLASDWATGYGGWCIQEYNLAICAEVSDPQYAVDSTEPLRGWWQKSFVTSGFNPDDQVDDQKTYHFYYGNLCKDQIAANPSVLALILVERWVSDYQGTYTGGVCYLDNAMLIPEPATIALLGLGGLALIRRKR